MCHHRRKTMNTHTLVIIFLATLVAFATTGCHYGTSVHKAATATPIASSLPSPVRLFPTPSATPKAKEHRATYLSPFYKTLHDPLPTPSTHILSALDPKHPRHIMKPWQREGTHSTSSYSIQEQDTSVNAATQEVEKYPAIENTGSIAYPVRIVIADIGLDQPIYPTGLDEQNVPIVLKHHVGWYSYSATPGHGENIVLWGHVLRFKDEPNIPAPFALLDNVSIGTPITIHTSTGETFTYIVTQHIYATPDQVHYILPQGKELLTLVSCTGEQVIVEEQVELTHRLITIALPSW